MSRDTLVKLLERHALRQGYDQMDQVYCDCECGKELDSVGQWARHVVSVVSVTHPNELT